MRKILFSPQEHLTRYNKSYATFFISFLLAIAILIYRRPDHITNPALCAEDGVIFFNQAATMGWHSLFRPYAGYHLLVQRMVALAFSWLVPAATAPLAYNLTAGLLSALTSAMIAASRLDLPAKWLFAILPMLAPHGGEIFLFLTNVHWFFAPPLIVLAVQAALPEQRMNFLYFSFLFVMAMTGPFAVYLYPFFVIRYWLTRGNRNELIQFAVITIPVLIQIYTILSHKIYSYGPPVDWRLTFEWLFWQATAPLFGYKYFSPSVIVFLFLALSLPWLVSILRMPPIWRLRIFAMLAFALAIYISAMARIGNDYLMRSGPFSGNQRYFYIPYVMIAWSWFIIAAKGARHWRVSGGFALAICLSINCLRFVSPPLTDQGCHQPDELIEQLDRATDE